MFVFLLIFDVYYGKMLEHIVNGLLIIANVLQHAHYFFLLLFGGSQDNVYHKIAVNHMQLIIEHKRIALFFYRMKFKKRLNVIFRHKQRQGLPACHHLFY